MRQVEQENLWFCPHPHQAPALSFLYRRSSTSYDVDVLKENSGWEFDETLVTTRQGCGGGLRTLYTGILAPMTHLLKTPKMIPHNIRQRGL